MKENIKITIVGLGYVGLPLAVEFSKYFFVNGFDVNSKRIDELKKGIDSTHEVNLDELKSSKNLTFTFNERDISDSNVYIVTVPTPIDEYKSPDLSPLISASKLIGKNISKGDYVVYESTVFPGCTEDECVPILEKYSGLRFNKDFFVGYSPERINPGDKTHHLRDIIKITSGSSPAAADFVDNLYGSIINAGTHKAQSIKVAEAAKVIENTQRDLNIGLMNELGMICNELNIDTHEVIKAASTKWNFLPFYPGLVGGHCISVDPYYLTYRAKAEGISYTLSLHDALPI